METIPTLPIGSMYGIFNYVWVILRVNVDTYSIHGAYGLVWHSCDICDMFFFSERTVVSGRNPQVLGKNCLSESYFIACPHKSCF